MVKRLIDAEALLEKAWDVDCRCGYVQVVDVDSIENAPTIEAKPVVHACWKEIRQGLHICSHCKVKASLTSDEYDYMEDLSDYCPRCGAQMDEVIE